MSDQTAAEADHPSHPAEAPGSTAGAAPVTAASGDHLDDIEGIDFLLEEIENKIAPLALA